jgi:hypothetical protein
VGRGEAVLNRTGSPHSLGSVSTGSWARSAIPGPRLSPDSSGRGSGGCDAQGSRCGQAVSDLISAPTRWRSQTT